MTAAHDGRIDTVLCDVGDVILLFDHAVAGDIEARHGLRSGSLLNTALKSPHSRRATVGGIDTASWRRATAEVVGDQAVADWLAYHGHPNLEVIMMLRVVRQLGSRVVLLSNATARLWDDLAFHGLQDLADAIFCSADIRLAKPDPACYLYAAHHGGFQLERAVYIDDTASWVSAGQALGLRGHVFVSAGALRAELAELDLIR